MPTTTTATSWARKRARPILLAQLQAAGTLPCPRCREPMSIGQQLDVGHERAVAEGGARSRLRLEHTRCNRSDGFKLAVKIARANKANGNPTRRRTEAEQRELDRRDRLAAREAERQRRLNRRVIIVPGGPR